MAIPKPTIEQRVDKVLAAKVSVDTNHVGCWTFQGYTKRGYGYIMHERKNWLAHRLVYTALVGAIPEGLTLEHTCMNRACVNPKHLVPMTLTDNQRQSPNSNISKTHCKRGHKFTPDNTVKVPGGRGCRTCRSDTQRQWRQSLKAGLDK